MIRAAAFAFFFSLTIGANASVVRLSFEASIEFITTNNLILEEWNGYELGQSFSGSITYDSSAEPIFTTSSRTLFDSITSFDIGLFDFGASNYEVAAEIEQSIITDFPPLPTADLIQFRIREKDNGQFFKGFGLTFVGEDLFDDKNTLITGVIGSQLSPTGDSFDFVFSGPLNQNEGIFRIVGYVDTLLFTPVPLPATAWLFLSALVGLVSARNLNDA